MFLTLNSVPGPDNVKTQARALKGRPSPASPQVALPRDAGYADSEL